MPHSPSKRILLIDSDRAVHDGFRRILCAANPSDTATDAVSLVPILENIEIDTAVDGPKGKQLFERALQQGRPYLLAIVSLSLDGELNGLRTVQRLWHEDSTLPVLLCTEPDFTVDDRHQVTRELGRLDQFLFLPKPLDADLVCQLVALQADRRLARDKLLKMTRELGQAVELARDEAELANRARDEFIANITHEIRTPMNAILGFTRLLLKDQLSEDQLEKLQFVRNAGTSLMALISNVLDYSKLTAGQLKLMPTTFDLDSVLSEALEASSKEAHDKGLIIEHQIADKVPRRLRGDRTRFRQILTNLIDNAVKFTDYGVVHFRVALDEETEQTATLRITITDTGVGIPADRQAVIFESFSQADGSSTRQFEGAGLGLSICRQLVALMGGQIGFRSDPGEGSCFWLTLTLEKHASHDRRHDRTRPSHDNRMTATADAPRKTPESRGGKPYILVVDDNPLDRTLAEMLLTRAGCLVDLADDGEEALARWKRTPYDLVLMDIEMPEMDGNEAIERIRSAEATTGEHVRIIAVTGHTTSDDRARCFAAGADEFVAKPYTPEKLIETVIDHFPECRHSCEPQTDTPQSNTPSAYFQALSDAVAQENLREAENAARALKELSTQGGLQSIADQAMRVQLAARSGDPQRVSAAMERLKSVLETRPVTAVPETTNNLSPS